MFLALVGWLGAAAMVAASFNINSHKGKALAIFGLTLLSIQAVDAHLYNLVSLNVASIIGYFWSMRK